VTEKHRDLWVVSFDGDLHFLRCLEEPDTTVLGTENSPQCDVRV
jgi:hypothetical protein